MESDVVYSIYLKDNSFIPDYVNITVNSTIVFVNEDKTVHNITCKGLALFSMLAVRKGKPESFTFTTTGKYEISEVISSEMKCILEVTEISMENLPNRKTLYFPTTKEKQNNQISTQPNYREQLESSKKKWTEDALQEKIVGDGEDSEEFDYLRNQRTSIKLQRKPSNLSSPSCRSASNEVSIGQKKFSELALAPTPPRKKKRDVVVTIENMEFSDDILLQFVGYNIVFQLSPAVHGFAEHQLSGISKHPALCFESPVLDRDNLTFVFTPPVAGEIAVTCQVYHIQCFVTVVEVPEKVPKKALTFPTSRGSDEQSAVDDANTSDSSRRGKRSRSMGTPLMGTGTHVFTGMKSLEGSVKASNGGHFSDSQSSFYDSDDEFEDDEDVAKKNATRSLVKYGLETSNSKVKILQNTAQAVNERVDQIAAEIEEGRELKSLIPSNKGKTQLPTLTDIFAQSARDQSGLSEERHVVFVEEYSFRPSQLTIHVGDTVELVRSGKQCSVCLYCEHLFSDVMKSAEEDRFTFVFTEKGSFDIRNEVYGFMTCTVIVLGPPSSSSGAMQVSSRLTSTPPKELHAPVFRLPADPPAPNKEEESDSENSTKQRKPLAPSKPTPLYGSFMPHASSASKSPVLSSDPPEGKQPAQGDIESRERQPLLSKVDDFTDDEELPVLENDGYVLMQDDDDDDDEAAAMRRSADIPITGAEASQFAGLTRKQIKHKKAKLKKKGKKEAAVECANKALAATADLAVAVDASSSDEEPQKMQALSRETLEKLQKQLRQSHEAPEAGRMGAQEYQQVASTLLGSFAAAIKAQEEGTALEPRLPAAVQKQSPEKELSDKRVVAAADWTEELSDTTQKKKKTKKRSGGKKKKAVVAVLPAKEEEEVPTMAEEPISDPRSRDAEEGVFAMDDVQEATPPTALAITSAREAVLDSLQREDPKLTLGSREADRGFLDCIVGYGVAARLLANHEALEVVAKEKEEPLKKQEEMNPKLYQASADKLVRRCNALLAEQTEITKLEGAHHFFTNNPTFGKDKGYKLTSMPVTQQQVTASATAAAELLEELKETNAEQKKSKKRPKKKKAVLEAVDLVVAGSVEGAVEAEEEIVRMDVEEPLEEKVLAEALRPLPASTEPAAAAAAGIEESHGGGDFATPIKMRAASATSPSSAKSKILLSVLRNEVEFAGKLDYKEQSVPQVPRDVKEADFVTPVKQNRSPSPAVEDEPAVDEIGAYLQAMETFFMNRWSNVVGMFERGEKEKMSSGRYADIVWIRGKDAEHQDGRPLDDDEREAAEQKRDRKKQERTPRKVEEQRISPDDVKQNGMAHPVQGSRRPDSRPETRTQDKHEDSSRGGLAAKAKASTAEGVRRSAENRSKQDSSRTERHPATPQSSSRKKPASHDTMDGGEWETAGSTRRKGHHGKR